MKKSNRWFVVSSLALSLALPLCALADPSYKSKQDFPNPGGCRAYDTAVLDDCDGFSAPKACQATAAWIQQLAARLPGFQVKTECKRLHTGSFWWRFLDEDMMDSESYDGNQLELTVKQTQSPQPLNIKAQAPDAATCNEAASAFEGLAAQGLHVTASCDAQELSISF